LRGRKWRDIGGLEPRSNNGRRGSLKLDGDVFTCEWHCSTFDARTGKALSGPVRPDTRLIMLPTRVEEGVLTCVYEEHPET
jgi:nitrite reductase/ring-hydroxylating ferredoxin subunit